MITVRAIITSKLAIAVGELAKKHPEQSVEIRYDDVRDPQLWEVIFERLDGQPDDRYLVVDETGEALPL